MEFQNSKNLPHDCFLRDQGPIFKGWCLKQQSCSAILKQKSFTKDEPCWLLLCWDSFVLL